MLVPVIQCSASSSSCSAASSGGSCYGSPLNSRVPAVRFLLPMATTSPSHSPTSSPAHRLRSKRSRLRLAQRANHRTGADQTANEEAAGSQTTNDRATTSQTANKRRGGDQRANHGSDRAKTAKNIQAAGERAVGNKEERERRNGGIREERGRRNGGNKEERERRDGQMREEAESSRWNGEAGLPVSDSQSDGSQLSVSLLSCQSNAAKPPPHSLDSHSEASQLYASLLLDSQPGTVFFILVSWHYIRTTVS